MKIIQSKLLSLVVPLVFSVTALAGGDSGESTANGEMAAPQGFSVCTECHGAVGQSAIPGWPPVAGMSKSDLVSKLKGYRENLVPESVMGDVTHNFTDSQIDEIAEYYSQLPGDE